MVVLLFELLLAEVLLLEAHLVVHDGLFGRHGCGEGVVGGVSSVGFWSALGENIEAAVDRLRVPEGPARPRWSAGGPVFRGQSSRARKWPDGRLALFSSAGLEHGKQRSWSRSLTMAKAGGVHELDVHNL